MISALGLGALYRPVAHLHLRHNALELEPGGHTTGCASLARTFLGAELRRPSSLATPVIAGNEKWDIRWWDFSRFGCYNTWAAYLDCEKLKPAFALLILCAHRCSLACAQEANSRSAA